MCSCRDVDIVWKYADWVMDRDEVLGVKVSKPVRVNIVCNVMLWRL